jgi:hypothetical protein
MAPRESFAFQIAMYLWGELTGASLWRWSGRT